MYSSGIISSVFYGYLEELEDLDGIHQSEVYSSENRQICVAETVVWW